MKRFNKLKIIQLIVFAAAAAAGLIIIFRDAQLYQTIGFDSHVRALCIILWVALGLAFIFLFLDYQLDSALRRENEELNYAFYTDPDTGVANRNSCDAFISQYENRLLPDGMAAVTLVLSNLKELNDEYGYENGNREIGDFAEILRTALPKGDFLGRNGGDRFLIILRKTTRSDVDALLKKIEMLSAEHNAKEGDSYEIKFHAGTALQAERHAKTMHTLVAVSDRRASAARSEQESEAE